ncbi:probable G-protein coupled receptor 139 [Chiloscyllium plagiosum]|uniref:probable G-protein coupled receptor 139 n=1 Tax=Chiloscyllium plagiosum TaxID=36176 RepID=UPI001CB81CEF|nr:probable G-protein coupled receptor 139 [Chiloscyllium plagiosum]
MAFQMYDLKKSYYMVLAIIGLLGNLLAIMIFSRGNCGVSKCTTRYLVAMAIADLLVIIFEVILKKVIYYYEAPVFFLDITPACSAHDALCDAVIDCSVWFTIAFSFDRFVAVCCPNLRTRFCKEKTAAVMLSTTCILLCLKSTPIYFIYEPVKIVDNVPWFCYVKPNFYSDSGWVSYECFAKALTPLLPFALILLINTLTVRHILASSRVRKELKTHSNGEKNSDPEMESRRKSVILLFAISGSFIFLWLMFIINFLRYTFKGTFYTESELIFQDFGFMFRNFSCCTNTFIYAAAQSKFREKIKNALKSLVS